MLLGLVCGLLALCAAVLAVRLALVRKAAREICSQMAQKLDTDTNTLLSISSADPAMCQLADQLNVQLAQLRQQRRRFEQGDLELKQAVTNISHDLRTPLTAIRGYLDLMEGEPMSPEVARCFAVIQNRTQMLEQLTEELFRYSMLTSVAEPGPSTQVVVNEVLEQSILDYYAALQQRQMTPQISLPPRKVVRTLNREALARIFSNLLQNALKYSAGDLSITLTEQGTITFSNTAPGLTQVQVQQLFDRFYTVDSARKSTGLGLSIARQLAQQLHGELTASYDNQMLQVCLQLPPAGAAEP